jgi:DNA-binding MarR family transcriptional regulator
MTQSDKSKDSDQLNVDNCLRLLQCAEDIRARLSGEFSAVHGLSVNEFFLLMQLERASMHRLSRVELARRMYVSASTVTRMATPMEKLGLLARESDPRDARLAFVVLTKAGARKVREARTTFAKQSSNVFRDRWTDAEKQQLGSLLDRIVADAPGSLT